MEIVFAGTPDFAAVILEGLIGCGLRPRLVLTQPDRVQGRGRKISASAVKAAASRHGIRVFQPETLSMKKEGGRAAVAEVLELPVDVFVVAAYGLMIPEPLLTSPAYGAINVHASLLPRWRGAAPVEYAIIAGDRYTGVSIMRMDRGLDTGPVLATESTHIDPDETGATLTARLATMGSELLCRCLPQLDQLMSTPQDDSTATIAPKLRPSIAAINWNNPATVIHNQVRALAGRQTAWSTLRHRNQSVLVKVHAGESLSGKSANQPGSIVQHNRQDIIVVQTGEGLYGIRLLQLAAGKGTIQAAAAARNGFVFLAEQAGAVFEFST